MPIPWPTDSDATGPPQAWIAPEVPQGWEARIRFQSTDRASIRLEGQPGSRPKDSRYATRSILAMTIERAANTLTLESIVRREDETAEDVFNTFLDLADALRIPDGNRYFDASRTTKGAQQMIQRFQEVGVLHHVGGTRFQVVHRAPPRAR